MKPQFPGQFFAHAGPKNRTSSTNGAHARIQPAAGSGLASNSFNSRIRPAGTIRWVPDNTCTCETPSDAYSLTTFDIGQSPSARLGRKVSSIQTSGRGIPGRFVHASAWEVELTWRPAGNAVSSER